MKYSGAPTLRALLSSALSQRTSRRDAAHIQTRSNSISMSRYALAPVIARAG